MNELMSVGKRKGKGRRKKEDGGETHRSRNKAKRK
jgi:hypothetical protein